MTSGEKFRLGSEDRLAATIRDYMRARDAGDERSVEFGAESICHLLGCLLGACLRDMDDWNSDERWIDGMVGAQVEVLASDRIRVAGHMVWGLLSDVGGAQWAEPFEADLTIGWKTYDLTRYSLRFADHRGLDEKRVTSGSYAALANANGSIRFKPTFSESGKCNGFPDQTTHPPVTWRYEFKNAGSKPPPGTEA